MRHELFVPGTVRGQGSLTLWRGNDGKERAKHPPATVEWRNLLCGRLSESWAGSPMRGPVRVGVVATFARPLGHMGTGKNAGRVKDSAPIYHTSFPDLDKIIRLVDDALVIAGILADDCLVASVTGRKIWAPIDQRPGALIVVEEL